MNARPLWTVAEVGRALGLSGDFPDTAISFVTQDSRLVKPGSLFVALSGTPSGGFVSSFASARDGWEFAANAQSSGAVAMIVPHRIDGRSAHHFVCASARTSVAICIRRSIASTTAGPPQFHSRPGITTTRVRSESAASTGWRRISVASAGGPSRLALTIRTSTAFAATASKGICP